MATVDHEVNRLTNSRSTSNNTAAKSNLITDNQGILDIGKFINAYSELADKLKDTFDQAAHSADIALDAAEKVAKEAQEIKNATKDAKTEKQAKSTSYQEARKQAIDEGDYSTANKLRTKQRQEEAKDNAKIAKQQGEAMKDNIGNIARGIFTLNKEEMSESFKALKDNLKELTDNFGGVKKAIGVGFIKALDSAASGLSNLADGLKSTIRSIAGFKTAWDTRLFGSDKDHTYLSNLIKDSIAVSPYMKQENVMQKLNSAIEQGINYNVEQRAFLDVLSDTVATTFDAFDETLKNLVRVQQADSTAYRLGMESSLTEYLNKMFESTEYLTTLSDSVTANLYEATSLLDASKAIGYEYQIQKWLGSMYSVGMSSSSVQSISQALGQLLSGDISGTESGAGKLLVMAAANSGVDYAKLLTDGINESDVNILLGSMVDYLQQIASDNKVVQSQMASIFGLKTSDIEAAQNLTGFLSDIYNMDSDYGAVDAISKLTSMVSTMGSRISMGGLLENLTDNFKYTLAEGIAANPALYGILTIGDLLDQTVGGINIPTVSVFGNAVDLETTVADLLKSTAMAGSIMTGLGAIFNGLGQFGTGFGTVLDKFMTNSANTVSIGSGFGITAKENDVSLLRTNYVGNGSSDSYMAANSALITDTKNEVSPVANNSEEVTKTNDDICDNQAVLIAYLKKLIDDKDPVNVNVNNFPADISQINEFLRNS